MIVRVELRDTDFNILEILDNQIMNLTWEYNRIGGCGSFSFDLPREFCNEKFISGDFNVRIYARNDSTGDYDLWYQGIVENKAPNVRGSEETISVQGHGYQAQLSRIYVNQTYAATEISAIITSILDTYITPNTDITYAGGDITATGFTPDSIQFNTDALSAIQTLADIVGAREWGVDEDRKFYFKQRSSTLGLLFPFGGNVTAFTDDDSFKDIANRIVIQGGDVGGSPYTPDPTGADYNDVPSQTKYGRRDFVYQNSSIITASVAEQFASSILTERKDVIRRARCELVNYETRLETTIPIPLFAIVARGTLYNEKTYGTFLYSGQIAYQVNRINYALQSSDSNIRINLDLGQPRPNIAESIGQLKYQLEQLRGANL